MLTFFDKPEDLIRKRVAYRDYKNPPKGEGYCPIKDTYDGETKTIEVEESGTITKWGVIFEDISYILYSYQYYAEKITYNGKYKNNIGEWVTDLYIENCSDDCLKIFKEAFVNVDIYEPDNQKKLNEANKEFETYFRIEFIEKLPKESLNFRDNKVLLSGIYWSENKKCLFEF